MGRKPQTGRETTQSFPSPDRQSEAAQPKADHSSEAASERLIAIYEKVDGVAGELARECRALQAQVEQLEEIAYEGNEREKKLEAQVEQLEHDLADEERVAADFKASQETLLEREAALREYIKPNRVRFYEWLRRALSEPNDDSESAQ